MSDNLKRKRTAEKQSYLQCVRDNIEQARQEREEERDEQAIAAANALSKNELSESEAEDHYNETSDEEFYSQFLEE